MFHVRGMNDVADISQAYRLLSPVLGVSLASVLFAVALLCSGQNSTLTGDTGRPDRDGGLPALRLPGRARRLITRGIAIVPVVVVIALYGESGTAELLVFSQVMLSMQLPFAVIPLVLFVSNRRKLANFVIPRSVAALSWMVAGIIVALNVKLLFDTVTGSADPPTPPNSTELTMLQLLKIAERPRGTGSRWVEANKRAFLDGARYGHRSAFRRRCRSTGCHPTPVPMSARRRLTWRTRRSCTGGGGGRRHDELQRCRSSRGLARTCWRRWNGLGTG